MGGGLVVKYYIYVAICDDGVVRYIGKGKDYRYQHITSGRSSSVGANKYILEGGIVESKIILDNLEEQEALILESQLIDSIRPEWNVLTPQMGLPCSDHFLACIDSILELEVPYSDVNYFENVVTESELIESCKYDHADMSESAEINHETLCFKLMQQVGVIPFSKWYNLSNYIQRRNMLCIELNELMRIVGFTSKSQFSSWVSTMKQHGMLIVAYPEGTKNQRRVVYFNPWLVWKGSYRVRGRYRYLWNKMKGIDR